MRRQDPAHSQSVDQHLFQNLRHLLGQTIQHFSLKNFLKQPPNRSAENYPHFPRNPACRRTYPILVFYLRPGAKFHDSHPVEWLTMSRFTDDADHGCEKSYRREFPTMNR